MPKTAGVFFSIFVLIHDYSTPLSLDGFPNATTLLSLSSYIFVSNIAETNVPMTSH